MTTSRRPSPADVARRVALDERGLITKWLIRIVVLFTLLGVVAFDAGAIGVAKVQVDGIAIDAAAEAGRTYRRTGSARTARLSAEKVAQDRDAEVVGFSVAPDRKTVRVTLEKIATTLVAHRIGPTKQYTRARSSHDGAVR